jgi:hypothetical protein
MLEFLRDPAIQAVLVLVGIIVTIIVYWKQRQRKSLGYEVLSCTPLSSVDRKTLDNYRRVGLQFKFHGQTIRQGHFITVKVTNTGNVPIKKDDYDEEINLTFGEKAKILATRVVEKKPDTIPVTMSWSEAHKVIISKILLNSKDSFVVELLVSDFDGKVRVGGRIVGVKEIKDTRGGIPTSREEVLAEEAFVINAYILLFALIYEAHLVTIIAILVLILQGVRKLKLKAIRQFERGQEIPR